LSVALVAVVAFGLIVSDVATYTALRSYLLRRVDQQLASAQAPMLRYLLSDGGEGFGFPPSDRGSLPPPGTFAQLYDTSGNAVRHVVVVTYGGSTLALPDVPSALASAPLGASPFSVGALGGGRLHYRVLAGQVSGGLTEVVAIPLTEMSDTLGRLLAIAGLATLAVLAGMAVLAWVMVRRELRPLERVEQTAGAIAAGDLSRRVDAVDPKTEVGRLGIALNVMLGRIEDAMDERRASEEALRRFLADASHELRTPLTSIRGYAELFRRGAGAKPQDTALAMRRIEQESERMGALVEDLLFLERAGQGRPIAHEKVDLVAIATDAVHDARAVDGSRPISLDAPGTLDMDGDESRLRQVFANLLSNALEHTPNGTPIEVKVSNDDGWAVASVHDSGPGIEPEQAEHIFEPFYRADPSRGRSGRSERQGSGTGLGLAIVEAVVEAHGGSIQVEGGAGLGATFTLRVPIVPPRRDEQEDD
jgi:Signal transduction histidine kinase